MFLILIDFNTFLYSGLFLKNSNLSHHRTAAALINSHNWWVWKWSKEILTHNTYYILYFKEKYRKCRSNYHLFIIHPYRLDTFLYENLVNFFFESYSSKYKKWEIHIFLFIFIIFITFIISFFCCYILYHIFNILHFYYM